MDDVAREISKFPSSNTPSRVHVALEALTHLISTMSHLRSRWGVLQAELAIKGPRPYPGPSAPVRVTTAQTGEFEINTMKYSTSRGVLKGSDVLKLSRDVERVDSKR